MMKMSLKFLTCQMLRKEMAEPWYSGENLSCLPGGGTLKVLD